MDQSKHKTDSYFIIIIFKNIEMDLFYYAPPYFKKGGQSEMLLNTSQRGMTK